MFNSKIQIQTPKCKIQNGLRINTPQSKPQIPRSSKPQMSRSKIKTPKSDFQRHLQKMKRSLEIICFYLFLFLKAVHWISRHVPNHQIAKNWGEFPLGGPSPCGKAGLAPCRQCMFSSFSQVLWIHSFKRKYNIQCRKFRGWPET